jgi:hypothetical protein
MAGKAKAAATEQLDATENDDTQQDDQEEQAPPPARRDSGKQPVAQKRTPPGQQTDDDDEDEETEAEPVAKTKKPAKKVKATDDDVIEEIDLETYNDLKSRAELAASLQSDMAALQKQLKTLQTENKTYKDEKLSDQEKREQAFKEAQDALAATKNELRQARMESAVAAAAAKLTNGAMDAELAITLIGKDITFDDEGKPQNVEQAIRAAIQKWPSLNAQPKKDAGNGNSKSRRDQAPDLTFEDIMEMDEDEIEARQEEVDAVLAGNSYGKNGRR